MSRNTKHVVLELYKGDCTCSASPKQVNNSFLRDSFHCGFRSKLIFPSAEFKSLSLVHAQITTYWEKRPPWTPRHSRCCQSRISKDSRRPAQLCSKSRRGKVQVNQALQPLRCTWAREETADFSSRTRSQPCPSASCLSQTATAASSVWGGASASSWLPSLPFYWLPCM